MPITSRATLLREAGRLIDRMGAVAFIYRVFQLVPLNVGAELLSRVRESLDETDGTTVHMPAVVDRTAERERLRAAALEHIEANRARRAAERAGQYRVPAPAGYRGGRGA